LSKPEAQSPWRLAREASLVGGSAVAAGLITHAAAKLSLLSATEASSALAVLAGALALATAAMWHVVRWLTGDGRASLFAGAMALYGLVAVPTTAIGSELDARGAVDAGRTAAHLVVVVLLLASSMESMAGWRPGSRKLLVVGLLTVLATITFGVVAPSHAVALSQVPTLRWLVAAGWVLAGVRITRVAVRRGLAPSVRVGLGLTLLALAHCYRLATEIARPDSPPGLAFSTLRLVALLFIGIGALQFCRRALHSVRDEIRPRQPETAAVRLAEDAFEIGPTVRATAARYQAAGIEVQCDVAPGLLSRGSREVLDQVLTHLLSDCARHAPGSPIKILAWDAGERVLVRVSDKGPDAGRPGPARPVPTGPPAEHQGRSLATCRELLADLGGEIRVHRRGPGRLGCTVQVELPSAFDPGPDSASVDGVLGFSAFASVQAQRAARVFDEATQAARRVAAVASRPSGGDRLGALPRLAAALALFGATMAVSRVPAVSEWLSVREVGVALALVAVAGGVLSAFGCAVLGQLGDEPAGLWLSAGLSFYSVVGIPVATYNANSPVSDAAVSNLRYTANTIFVVLTLAAVFTAGRPRRDGWVVLGFGLMLGLGAAGLGVAYPAESLALTTNSAARFVLCGFWLLSGALVVAAGWARRTPWLSWAGLGYTVIAIAHTARVASGSPFNPLGPTFPSLRLLGVLLLVGGVLPAARRVLVESYTARHRQLAELQVAKTDIQRFAERDHDIRGGLAVLANANVLLESRVRPPEEQEMLRSAVNAELKRLHELLRPPDADDGVGVGYDYEIADVIQERITLQTSPDMDVRVDIEPNLWAYGNPLVLAQVVANVLANWHRHAPGSPLRIQAVRHDDRVVLRVCDFGPGIPPELGDKVFDVAVRGPASPGQGFGLHICKRLLEDESGRIYLQRREGRGTGCTVVIELPAAESDGFDHHASTGRSAS
jgi:two-component system OmpR family sensor kinase